MQNLPIALQVYTVRDEAAKDFAGTMQIIKDLGYQGVELAGLYGHPVEVIHEVLSDVGLAAISAHVPYSELTGDMEQTIDCYITIGCKYIAIPYLEDNDRPGAPGFADTIEKIKQIGRMCREKGVVLLYHNHDFEFVRMENGKYGLDYLYEAIDRELLQTELDTCWINVAGESPVDYINKYADRSPIVHFKDFHMSGRSEDAQLYELVGQEGNQSQEQERNEARLSFEFRPVGYGQQDIPAILKATLNSNAQWIVVEQDLSVDRPPLEAAEMSIKYLRGL